MAQLIMNWVNDGSEYQMPPLPEGMSVKTLPEIDNGVKEWLDIIRFMWQKENNDLDEEFYQKLMTDFDKNYDDNMCYFLLVDGAPAATITVICDYEKGNGYIHMVACKPNFRGKGIGHILNNIALNALKKAGMKTAFLTTDDWRLAAIKTYLKVGFTPDLESEPDFKERWEKIYKALDTVRPTNNGASE